MRAAVGVFFLACRVEDGLGYGVAKYQAVTLSIGMGGAPSSTCRGSATLRQTRRLRVHFGPNRPVFPPFALCTRRYTGCTTDAQRIFRCASGVHRVCLRCTRSGNLSGPAALRRFTWLFRSESAVSPSRTIGCVRNPRICQVRVSTVWIRCVYGECTVCLAWEPVASGHSLGPTSLGGADWHPGEAEDRREIVGRLAAGRGSVSGLAAITCTAGPARGQTKAPGSRSGVARRGTGCAPRRPGPWRPRS